MAIYYQNNQTTFTTIKGSPVRMKKFFLTVAVLTVALVAAAKFATTADAGITTTIPRDEKSMKDAESGTYTFDKAHSFIGFKVKHMGLIDVPGYFRDFTGTVNYDAADATRSTVEFSAKATSVDTGVAGRDNHLRSADFFEVEKFPEITFKSTKVAKHGNDLHITGDFTMKGVTKSITFEFDLTGFVKDQRGGAKIGISADTKINRRDYGINYGTNMPNGTPTLSDIVEVDLEIEVNKPGAPRPNANANTNK
jgi:polyisoprenoid-binding protein YceI